MEGNNKNLVGGSMERYIFIHGSASGQSSLPLSEASAQICNEIGNWYFEGRENRKIGTNAVRSMFVELYKGIDNKRYCLYSFVLNECFGPAPEPRPGQYFAVTIALRESYCIQPSSIYNILSSAFDQLICNKIIADKMVVNGKTYTNVYTIGQFKDKSAELIDFQNKIATFFDRDCLQLCKTLPSTTNLPQPWNGKPMTKMAQNRVERLPWNGETIHRTECDSLASAEKLWKDGRIYVSEEAPLPAVYIQRLQEDKKQLEAKNKALQFKVDNPTPNPKDKKEIANLKVENETLRKDAERINSEKENLQKENQDLLSTFDDLSQLISKYKGTTGNQLGKIDNQLSKEVQTSRGWKRWIKGICLLLILLLTLICLVLNICFFRNFSSISDEISSQKKRIDTLEQRMEVACPDIANTSPAETPTVSNIATSEPVSEQKSSILVEAVKNAETTATSDQKSTKTPDYGLLITDEKGKIVKSVKCGQTIKASVKKPASNLVWKFDGVTKKNPNDVNPIDLEVVSKKGTITIGYGDANDKNKRQRISIKIENEESSGQGNEINQKQ